ncbi:MAG TPA: carbon starvation protein A [Aquifex aeolicus]|uniref:Carbon starvation protein A n=1 Tax=Aquifex aeolicus TaxID=63363 RepID=A0A9D1CF68_AQUAO|nr:carbon starvation protein A [Aquificales bacterium]HIP97822.1 carbon starvation protein A [Aquifex aeolicus]HIQ26326.1 carbon starvation protein A [Aquifex aeolicus]
MNTTLLIAFGILALWLGYKIYGSLIERRIAQPDDSRPTPAHEKFDGLDYVPANKWVLLGHHFASIAGAGPIIGPVLAASLYGWLPAYLWIIFGGIFMGAVHDYLSLVASVKEKGASIVKIAEKGISPLAKNMFSIFLFVALSLVVGVFAVVTAKTFIKQPELVLPSFGLILVAIFVGTLIYRFRFNVWLAALIGFFSLLFLLWLGYKIPVTIGVEYKPDHDYWFSLTLPSFGLSPFAAWTLLLLGYAFVASVTPVWILLQPRDFLATFQLIFGLTLGILGALFAGAMLKAPALAGLHLTDKPLWPFMFVIIACGAISGFHSLVASGTTSKQLDKESDAKLVGFGGMLLESLLALVALLSVTAGLYWLSKPQWVEGFVFQELLKQSPILAFGYGYGELVSQGLPFIAFAVASFFGMMMLNAFVMTTLDSASRINRLIFTDLTGIKNKYIASLAGILIGAFFALTNAWTIIWPVFGSANQLIAALTLIVLTAYLIGVRKPTKYTLIPALFMSVTTLSILLFQTVSFLINGKYILSLVSLILFLLAAAIAREAYKVFAGYYSLPEIRIPNHLKALLLLLLLAGVTFLVATFWVSSL